ERQSLWEGAAAGLWVLGTVGVAAARRCLLSHYRSLDPRALAAAKALRDRYEEETLSWRPRNCSFWPRRDRPRQSSCVRLRLVARGLADAQAVLSSLRSPELLPGLGGPLELLAATGRDVAACVSVAAPRASPPASNFRALRCRRPSVSLVRILGADMALLIKPR
uniref:Uncharacterized protein n=1 Tax=Equus asinus TaxID=9793 RepID=A0A9L0KJG6_EQUAS